MFGARQALLILLRRLLLRRVLPLAATAARARLRRWLAAVPVERPILLIAATVDLASPYRQRVQHLARAFADLGWQVVYGTPAMGYDRVILARRTADGTIVTPHIAEVPAQGRRSVLMVLSADARVSAAMLERHTSQGGIVLYDFVDACDRATSNAPFDAARLALHRRLLGDEARVFVSATASALSDEVARYRRSGWALISNGVELAPFRRASRQRIGVRPDFLAILDRRRPLLGYYGALASWFDVDLVRALAQARPGYDIVLIGPDLDGTSAALHPPLPNLFVLAAFRYEDLPRHAIWFDVALIPFRINAVTQATSPLKLFEYLALGLPTVSVDLPECRKLASCRIASDQAGFIKAVDLGLADRADADAARRAFMDADASTWQLRASELAAALLGWEPDAAGERRPVMASGRADVAAMASREGVQREGVGPRP